MDPSAYFIQENLQEKVVYDPPCRTDNLSVASDGRLALLSRHCLHIYEPQFVYTAFYKVSWIVLNPALSSKVTASTDYSQQVAEAAMNESRLFLAQSLWLPGLLRDGEPHLLLLLLSDGNILIFRRAFAHQEDYLLSNGLDKIRMMNYSLLFDLHKEQPHASDRCLRLAICNHKHTDNQMRVLLFGVTASRELLLWELRATHDRRSVVFVQLKRYCLTVANEHPINSSASTILTHLHEEHVEVLVSFRQGVLWRLVLDLQLLATQSSSLLPLPDELPVDKMLYSPPFLMLSSNEALYRINVPMFDGNVELVSEHGLEVSVVSHMTDWQGCEQHVLSAALDGVIKEYPGTDANTYLDSKAKHGIYGLAEDSFGLLCFYSYCAPAILSNSREVQLNNSLTKHRTVLTWKLNPSIDLTLMVSNLDFTQFILRMLMQREEDSSRSLAYLPMWLLSLMDAAKSNFRKVAMKTLPEQIKLAQDVSDSIEETPKKGKRTRRKSSSEAKALDCSSDSEGEEEATVDMSSDSSDSERDAPTSSSKKGTANKKTPKNRRTFSERNDEQGGFGLTFIYEKLKDFMDPNPVELAYITQEVFHQAALRAGYVLHHNLDYDFDDLPRDVLAMLQHPDTAVFVNSFLALPSLDDMNGLRRKVLLWQIWHVGIISVMKIRQPNPVESLTSEAITLLSTVRRLLAVANVAIQCNRYVTLS